MSSVLIAGCGYVGSALAQRCVKAGQQVWGLKRHPAGLPRGVRAIAADLLEPESLQDLPRELSRVYYCVGATAHSEEAYEAAYVRGLRNLLAALEPQRGNFRLLFTSSTGVYGQQGGEWVDETSPTALEGFASQILLHGEQLLELSGFEYTVLRLAGIYGPDRSWFLDQVRRGEVPFSVMPLYTNRIHRDDCAEALFHLGSLRSPDTLYLGCDDMPAPRNEVVTWLADRMEVPMPTRIVTHQEGTRERTNKRCRNDKLRATGFQFLYPTYKEGYASLLENSQLVTR